MQDPYFLKEKVIKPCIIRVGEYWSTKSKDRLPDVFALKVSFCAIIDVDV